MLRISTAETAVFAAVFAVSVTVFRHRIQPVLLALRRSRPEAGYSLRPLLPRLRVFLWEVVLQAKVIRERPLPGLAHALVFWGFCAFVAVTIDHMAVGIGTTLLPPSSFYHRVASAFAVAVAVAIAGLAARRFLARPRWLGALSPESGLIAFLIFLLMITYLAARWLPEESPAARLNWWTHTLALLVFLPLIPGTKHLHLLLSPFAVFFRRDGFSRIPPLAGDEDFGLVAGKDLSRIDALQAFSCVECGRCTEHCPAYLTGKALNPKEVILGLRRYLRDNGPGGDEPLLEEDVSQDAVFQCTTCGACESQCPVGIQHLPAIIGLRRGAVNTGAWEDERGGKLFLNLERYGNPLGLSAAERDKFIRKAGLPLFDGSQRYCLWLGCMGAYDPRGREVVLALKRVLDHLGLTYGVLKKERCTGDAARRLGNDLLFQQLAEFNLGEIAASKVTRLLSICPHCVRTIREDWRDFGARLAIEHHSELLARHGVRALGEGKIVFHDPCYLGRYLGIYDQPRAVASFLEPRRARHRSFCCGAGGGLTFLGEEQGKRVGVERAEELLAAGAGEVAVACPFCNTMLADALAGLGGPKPVDIVEIAARNLD
jgi:Fe-S oxidoreductase